ncbi:MAG: DUF4286 family protein [Phycisphaerales bacterium]|jgi:hypothetical protein|nr:DUF4286 family protein [Phycisphaerales bacterium]|tara:strand:- start:4242 stop:4562 length:321 start_codon:yes stop_codon:yes gene_type:complete
MHRYTVQCEFDREQVAGEWLRWLRDEHIGDMLAAGATRAEIIRLDGPAWAFRVDYEFPDFDSYERYNTAHADRLQTECLGRFPLDLGIRYERTSGECIATLPGSDQ